MGKLRNKIIADFLFALHVLWIALLIGGTIFMVYHHWYAMYHIVIVTGTLLFNLALGGCPLTRWEEKYRKRHNPDTYYHPNSFVATYAKRFLGLNVTMKQVNWLLILIKIASYYTAATLIVLRHYL
jgi:hypothetical protein